eukprot:TRINITY_DN13465_c0_g1_i1.p1 TRINITY_DN13465_c0_g1~~TRINITY_DN13465_c0_g1_i1.p1  ORF type:complete len:142 (+),score=25.98 TRINITY_DN13465_c0_g1_i1:38-427(+)
MIDYGLDDVVENAALVGRAMRSAFRAMNIQIVSEEFCSANTITAAHYPPGIGPEFLRLCEENGLIITTGGYGGVAYFRVSHMGISARELHRGHLQLAIQIMERSLLQLGHTLTPGAGLTTLETVLFGEK